MLIETVAIRIIDDILEQVGLLEKVKFRREDLKLEAELAAMFKEVWDEQTIKALKKAAKIFEQSKVITQQQVEQALGILRRELGSKLTEKVDIKKITELLSAAYVLGKVSMGKIPSQKFAIEFTLDQEDKAAIQALQDHTMYWVGAQYDLHLRQKIANTVKKLAFGEGLGRKEVAETLKREVGSILESHYDYWDILSSAVIQRSRMIGVVRSFIIAKVKTYRYVAMLDERTCPICSRMHNRVFEVRHAKRIVESTLNAQEPDDVKKAWAWLSATEQNIEWIETSTEEELGLRDFCLPPLHGRCRCTVVVEEFEEIE